jgi:hypothetical protein
MSIGRRSAYGSRSILRIGSLRAEHRLMISDLRPTLMIMRSAVLLAVAMAACLPVHAEANELPKRWKCYGGHSVRFSEADGSITVRLACGEIQRLPQVAEVSGNITWNDEGSSLCENVRDLCVFSGSGEDSMFLFIFVRADEEPSSCDSID